MAGVREAMAWRIGVGVLLLTALLAWAGPID